MYPNLATFPRFGGVELGQPPAGVGLGLSTPDLLNVKSFGAIGDGVVNDAPALQRAFDRSLASGLPLYMPNGRYRVTSTVTYSTSAVLAPGLRLVGDGIGRTIIDNQVANNPAILCTTSANFQLGGYIGGLTVLTTASQVNSDGIELKSVYNYLLEQVQVNGLSRDGVRITALIGDADASNVVTFRNSRLQSCGAWGYRTNVAAGVSQNSFIKFYDCIFDQNSIGGALVAGFQCGMDNCGFTLNGSGGGGVGGLQIGSAVPAVTNLMFTGHMLSFENNYVNSMIIQGSDGGSFTQTELALTTAVPFAGQSGIVMVNANNVKFDDTLIRIAADYTTYDAFRGGAGTDLVKIANSRWRTFDAVGQRRYNFDASTRVQIAEPKEGWARNHTGAITVTTDVSPTLVNDADYYEFTAAGAFNLVGLIPAFGFVPGRPVIIRNASGFTMTIVNEAAAEAIAARRITTSGGVNVAALNNSLSSLFYDFASSRWRFLSLG